MNKKLADLEKKLYEAQMKSVKNHTMRLSEN